MAAQHDVYSLPMPGIPQTLFYPSAGTFALDSTDDGVSWYLQPEEDMTVSHIGFDVTAFNNAASTATYQVELQTPNGAGPDGTALGGGSPASTTITLGTEITGTGWVWIALDNSIAVTRGQLLAPTIEPGSNIDGSNNISVTHRQLGYAVGRNTSFPRVATTTDFTTGPTWTPDDSLGHVGLKNSDASIVTGQPLDTVSSSETFTNTREQGNKFNIPREFLYEYQVSGVWMTGQFDRTTTDNLYVTLYSDPAGTPVVEQSLVFDMENGGENGNRHPSRFIFQEATLSTLSGGTDYVVAVVQDGTATAALTMAQFDSAADLDGWMHFSGKGNWLRGVERTHGAAITGAGDLPGTPVFAEAASGTKLYGLVPIIKTVSTPKARLVHI